MSTDWATWWGHSTLELRVSGVRLVTDPLLRRHIAFVLRWTADPPSRDLATGTDAVLVSHLHRDHLDLPSLALFAAGTRFLVPAGAGRLLRGVVRGPVTELRVGDVVDVDGVQVRATHAEHDGRRRVGPASERTSGPALGYLVCGPDSTTYFAGDTDMFAGMADLATGLATGIDLAVLPVGGWGLSLPIGHIDPVRAAEALPLLGATRAIPIHWGSLRIPGLWRLRPQLFIPPGPDFVAHAQLVAPQVDAFVATLGRPFEVTGPRSSFPRSSFPRA